MKITITVNEDDTYCKVKDYTDWYGNYRRNYVALHRCDLKDKSIIRDALIETLKKVI